MNDDVDRAATSWGVGIIIAGPMPIATSARASLGRGDCDGVFLARVCGEVARTRGRASSAARLIAYIDDGGDLVLGMSGKFYAVSLRAGLTGVTRRHPRHHDSPLDPRTDASRLPAAQTRTAGIGASVSLVGNSSLKSPEARSRGLLSARRAELLSLITFSSVMTGLRALD